MIDRKLLLSDFDMVLDNLRKRGLDDLGELGTLASEVKSLRTRTEAKRATQNSLSKDYAAAISASKDSIPGLSSPLPSGDAAALKARLDSIKDEIKSCSDQLKMAEDRLNAALLRVPNLLDSRTPLGRDESENLEMKRVLQPRVFDFTPKSHSELGHANGWIDSQRGVKLAKSRFSVLRGMGARLSHALISYMLDFNSERGFEICSVPVVVNENALIGTGQLPKFRDDMFKLESSYCEDTKRGHELYLISTSEVSLVNLYQDEIIPMQNLPIKLTAYTPCFRKEAGSAGRDTQGIMRQHQFDKVEIVAITSQEDSDRIQDEMVSHVSELLESLGLPHRLVQLCSGDVGFCASNTVDVEVWLPGQGCYREISSVSNCRDFQARRALIRYKDVGRNTLAHTLNGSSLAVGRTLVAIMENYQREDGSIGIPDALSKYI